MCSEQEPLYDPDSVCYQDSHEDLFHLRNAYQSLPECVKLTRSGKRVTLRRMSLEAWALAALQSRPTYYEDVGSPDKQAQLEMIAKAVTEAARETRGWPLGRKALIAAEISMLDNETHASLRIHRNECNLKKRECDGGRAISGWQLHANALSAPEVWPTLGFMTFESTKLAAKEASRVLVRMYLYCAAAHVPGDPIALMFTATGGHGCQLDKWEGWKPRLDVYQRVLRVPVPREAVAAESQKQAG